MKRLYFWTFIFFCTVTMSAQRYCSEWINYGQKYHKFPIVAEGVYRIDSTTLAKYYDLSQTDPRNFQLFLQGKEQRLFINGEGDGKINSNDFLEFYALPRSGRIDSLLYKDISYLPNPYIGLFTDTVYAFLTLNNIQSNLRYSVEVDTATAGQYTADHFYAEKIYTGYNAYNEVDLYDNAVSDPNYTQAEGKGLKFPKGYVIVTNFNLLNYTATPTLPVYVQANLSGYSREPGTSADHQFQILYPNQSNASVLLFDTTYYDYVPFRKSFVLQSGDLLPGANFSLASVAAPAFSSFGNSTMLHYFRIYYPQQLNLNGQGLFRMTLDNSSSSSKSFFNFGNFNNASALPPVFLDLTNGRRIQTVLAGSMVRVLVPNGAGSNNCVLVSENSITKITKLTAVSGSGSFIDFRTNVNRKPYLIIYHPNLSTAAKSYAAYRSSPAGGNYEVISANINYLYEQFSHGVNKHPMAIKNFVRYLKDTLSIEPAFVLLMGKAVKLQDISPSYQGSNLVPTMGIPSSDNLLTAGLTGPMKNYPEIPIGRLAAQSNDEVNDYLEKVKAHESTGLAEWKKRVLHFVGGGDEVLNQKLGIFMDGYAGIIADTSFGAKVFTFRKNTSAPVQLQISDSITKTINHGAALITFFGHGHEQGFDQAIDDPDNYSNEGRFPFMLANSCYSGNTYIFGRVSVSERFVFAKKKGSIGFLATSSYAFDNSLDYYSQRFYYALGKSKYNRPIGEVLKETCYQNSFAAGQFEPLVGLDMALHGDPAVVIGPGALPDFQTADNQVWFDQKQHSDSIRVFARIQNPGKAIVDSLGIRLTRYFPNNDSTVVLRNIRAPFNEDTFSVSFYTDFDKGIGLNRFKVWLDPSKRIAEIFENNNNTNNGVPLFVSGGDVLPVYPPAYAIIPNSTSVILKASTSDPFAPLTAYRFQLDTSGKFSTPITTTLISSKGGVLEWKVDLPYGNGAVYFWRVSRDSTSVVLPYSWRESSFQVLDNKNGWGQSHFQQFKKDGYQYVKHDVANRKFIFQNSRYDVMTRTGTFPYLFLSYFNCYYNNALLDGWSSAFNGFNLAVFDSASGQPWKAVQTNTPFGNAGEYGNCAGWGDRWVFSFGPKGDCEPNMGNWRQDMENFINMIPKNSYVLGYSTGYLAPYSNYSSYSNSLHNAFESLGVSLLRTTSDTVAFTFFGKKGMAKGQAHEMKGNSKSDIIVLNDTIITAWHSGYIASTRIGPANQWYNLHWKIKKSEATPGDTSVLKIIGIRSNGQADTLKTLVEDSTGTDLSNLVDAKVYPYLKLVVLMKDNINRTSPQIDKWQVFYEEVPECALNPLKGFVSLNDSLQEGDIVTFRFPIENIGSKTFKDSLVVSHWLEDGKRNKVPLADKVLKASFAPGEVIIDEVKLNSYQLLGNNTFWINVNPIEHYRYQSEQEQFNNIGRWAFKVQGDITNPLLDVTFDGVRILNGDLVSAKPNIMISLKDENKFLALNDTSAFLVYLQAPGQANRQRIYFAQGLEFTPAVLPHNSANIVYRPNLTTDGRYQLTVQAKDRSRNAAASNDYQVQFEVDTKPGVTHVLNYPNPFSSSTKFVFTLTGSEVPEVFTIQIMTVTGKLVKEITRGELGNVHIGRNITDYAWDGRDMYGDKLGNGVYLYRVVTRLNGDYIDTNGSGADKFFNKEFGKMVLMR